MLTSSDTASFFDAFGALRRRADGGRVDAHAAVTRDNLHLAPAPALGRPRPPAAGARHPPARPRGGARAPVRGRTVLPTSRPGSVEGHERQPSLRREPTATPSPLTEIERRLAPPGRPESPRPARGRGRAPPPRLRDPCGRRPRPCRAARRRTSTLENLLVVEMPRRRPRAGGARQHRRRPRRPGATSARPRDGRAVSAFAVRDGVVVAYADASVPGGDARHVDQYGTLVHPDHRGHRLGMAVKVRPAAAAGRALPRPRLHRHQQRRDQRPHGRDQRDAGLHRPPGVGRVREAARPNVPRPAARAPARPPPTRSWPARRRRGPRSRCATRAHR